MSLREIARIKELEEKVAKLEMQVSIVLDIYDAQEAVCDKKEPNSGKKKKN